MPTEEDILQHFGTKGMKWGVRNNSSGGISSRSDKKIAKADTKWEKSIYSTKGAIAVHNNVASQMNSHILPKLNNDPKYKGKNLYEDQALSDAYHKEYTKEANHAYSLAIEQVHGLSPSGKKYALYVNDGQNDRIEVRDRNVQHADTMELEPDLDILLKLNSLGHVIEANQASLIVSHGDGFVFDILEHHGIKGMKWGVRKANSSSSSPPGFFV